MKKCTPELILRNKRIARYREAARAKKAHKHCANGVVAYVRPGELIVAPTIINLAKPDGVELVRFLRAVSNTVLNMKMATRLDFRDTQTLHVAGAILLFAEIDRITKLSELSKPITIIEPREKRPREVLKQIGIYQLTGDSSERLCHR